MLLTIKELLACISCMQKVLLCIDHKPFVNPTLDRMLPISTDFQQSGMLPVLHRKTVTNTTAFLSITA